MPTDVIFKTFRTYKNPYVYDRHTNSLVMLTEDEYRELSQVEKGEVSPRAEPSHKKIPGIRDVQGECRGKN